MVCSPTGKGVVVIGGQTSKFDEIATHLSGDFIELSGDSIKSLKWTKLQQSLLAPKSHHVSFIIPTEVANELTKKQSHQ